MNSASAPHPAHGSEPTALAQIPAGHELPGTAGTGGDTGGFCCNSLAGKGTAEHEEQPGPSQLHEKQRIPSTPQSGKH